MASNGVKKRTQKAGQGESNVKKNRERERKREKAKSGQKGNGGTYKLRNGGRGNNQSKY